MSQIGRWHAWVLRSLLLISQLFAVAAHADVWGYVDDKGTAHFAAERLDARYELFFRGGESFDTSQGLPGEVAAAPLAGTPASASRLLAFFEVSPSYKQVRHHLREAALAQRIDYELLQALIATESGFDAQAVSPKGAVGLMQLMPATAQRYGVAGDKKTPIAQKLTDPRTNIRAGSRHLRDLLDRFPGQLDLVLAAYNAGEGAVQRAGNRVPNYRETQNYVKTVTQLYRVLKPPVALAGRGPGRAGSPVSVPGRIRMEIPGAQVPAGGALGRGNLPRAAGAAPAVPALPTSPALPTAAPLPEAPGTDTLF